jgi:hypothetical protein
MCIVMAILDAQADKEVLVLPITHNPPAKLTDAIEIPTVTKKRLGPCSERSWIGITKRMNSNGPVRSAADSRTGCLNDCLRAAAASLLRVCAR